jgi:hypothetical protein
MFDITTSPEREIETHGREKDRQRDNATYKFLRREIGRERGLLIGTRAFT